MICSILFLIDCVWAGINGIGFLAVPHYVMLAGFLEIGVIDLPLGLVGAEFFAGKD